MRGGIDGPFDPGQVMPWVDGEIPPVDLRTLLGEMAALKAELRASTLEARHAREQGDAALAVARDAVERAAQREAWLRESLLKEKRRGALALVDVVDRLEAAVRSLGAPVKRGWPWSRRPDTAIEALRQGLELTIRGAQERLVAMGVSRVPKVGQRFDPTRMEALRAECIAGREEGEVVDEIVSGWADDGGLLRSARVVVHRAAP